MFRLLPQSTENEELALKAQPGDMQRREIMAPSSQVTKGE